jgi:hypothetical protein
VIHAACVPDVDTIVACASVHLVFAFTGDDLVLAAAAFDRVFPTVTLEEVLPAATVDAVLPGATLDAVVFVGPEERILAAGAGEDFGQGFVRAEEHTDHHYHHREQYV